MIIPNRYLLKAQQLFNSQKFIKIDFHIHLMRVFLVFETEKQTVFSLLQLKKRQLIMILSRNFHIHSFTYSYVFSLQLFLIQIFAIYNRIS